MFLRHPEGLAAVATGVAAAAGLTAYLLLRKRATPEQKEAKRRARLATAGRVIDGELIDTAPEDAAPPHALIYRYRVAGVLYECAQNVSTLASLLPALGDGSALLGLPVQVRYDRDNPADSIVVAEAWNGLWMPSQSVAAHGSADLRGLH